MPNKTTKRTTPPPEPEAPPPAEAAANADPGVLAMLHYVYERAGQQERTFIVDLLEASMKREAFLTVTENALWLAARTWGCSDWLPLPTDSEEYYPELKKAYMMLLSPGWQCAFLKKVLRWHSKGFLKTPEDALDLAAEELSVFQNRIEEARAALRAHPDAVKDEIREALQKHPELLPA